MTETLMLFDPTASGAPESVSMSRPLSSLAGLVVGFIENTKPNFNVLADELGQLLINHCGVAKIVKYQKPNASVGAGKTAIDRLALQCDLVICGSGD